MNKQTLIHTLELVGLKSGDLVLVHSDIRPFGIPENTRTSVEILQFYFDAFMQVLGPDGTLAVPAYFYEYARYGETFDLERSPVSKPLGVFSAYVNSLTGRVRSCNPLQSLAAFGYHAEELCGGDSLMGYGLASPWHRLRTLGGKMLFMGVTLQPMTFVHHIEQQYGVPHLYQKVYDTPIISRGEPIPGTPISSVRYLEYDIIYDLQPFQQELDRRGQLYKAKAAQGELFLVNAEEAFQTGIELLSQNPYVFLKRPPAFIPGKIPADGITGKERASGK